MDLGNAYSQAGITGSIIALMGLSYKIYTAINHKRCKSRCCGYDIENSIDIGDTTPPLSIPMETFTNPMVDGGVCAKSTTQNRQVGTDDKGV
jgi:hypothetical protein